MSLQKKIVLCNCCSLDHQIVFVKFTDEPDTVYMEVHLTTHRNFFQRLKAGIMYAFGHKSRYGAWDEFILTSIQIKEIRAALK